MIVRLEKEAFKVLTQHGKEVNVPQHAIQLRKTRAVALDNKQNSITSKDVIRVIQGPHLVSDNACFKLEMVKTYGVSCILEHTVHCRCTVRVHVLQSKIECFSDIIDYIYYIYNL